VLIWEGLTRSFGYPTPDPTMANGAVWRKMALIRQPGRCGEDGEYEAGTWVTGTGVFEAKRQDSGGFRLRAACGTPDKGSVTGLAARRAPRSPASQKAMNLVLDGLRRQYATLPEDEST